MSEQILRFPLYLAPGCFEVETKKTKATGNANIAAPRRKTPDGLGWGIVEEFLVVEASGVFEIETTWSRLRIDRLSLGEG